MKLIINQKLFLFSFIILAGNFLLGYAVYKSKQNLIESEQWVEHTEQVIYQCITMFSTGNEIKTASRDFILTNNKTYIQALHNTAKKVFGDIGKIKLLTQNNPSQQPRIDSLNIYMHMRLAFALKVIEIRNRYGLTSAINYVAIHNDNYYSRQIHKLTTIIQQGEEVLLYERRKVNARSLDAFNKLFIFVFILMTGFTIVMLFAVRKYLLQTKEKEKRAAELVIANVELFYQNNEKEKRASELVIANEELLFQNKEKEKRAAELSVANKELSFQNGEKEKRAVELSVANKELLVQNEVREIAEKNLSQSESRLKEAQTIAHVGNFEVDIIKHSEVWSDEMYKIYGIDKKEVAPSKELFLSFIHPEDLNYITADINESFKSFKSSAFDFRFIHKDGSVRYAYSEAKFELDKNGQPIRLFGILQDVTTIKLGEIERTKMVNDLMVRNNDLEQFAYIISHNLRAPIANIIGASSVLNDIDISADDKDTLNKAINTSVMRLDDVVQDLNHILQVKGNINETKEKVHFSELVEDIKISIKSLITINHMDIKCDFSECNEFLTIKPYLYSIFYNLISNSIKYCMPHIPCSIIIKSRIVKNVLQLIFTDNGMGIDLKKKGDQVFGLYKRFHTNIEGKGMGLYMVKTQVEMLGGTISIKSEENIGTEFTIEFEV